MTGDDIGYAVYLSAFLLVIGGSYLVANRHRLGKTLQQAAIWVLIFLGVIVIYGFRDTLDRELFGGPQVAQDGDALILTRQPDGHFYVILDIDGTDVPFLVDTGASLVVLTKADARRIGIDVDSLAFVGTAYTANGVVKTAPIVLRDVRLGAFYDERVRASVNGGELDDSLLGMEYLGRFSEISIRDDKMTLRR